MNIDITKLKSGYEEYADVDIDYSFSKEQLEGTDLLELNDVKIIGEISGDLDDYYLSLTIEGIMILPCAVTLEPVSYPFTINLDDNYTNLMTETSKNIKKTENSIDIFPIIWENILMEIPMRVVSKKAKDIKLEGNGWKLITDDEESNKNNEFDKLNDLLK